MIADWLAREGGIVLSWWLLATLAGLAALPLSFHMLGGLSDRGYTLSRALGVLLTGFVFWLLSGFGLLRNTAGSVLLAWLIVLLVGLWMHASRRKQVDWRDWWHRNRRAVAISEFVFALLLIGWATVRAHQNGLTGTEKPMDLMFISSIMRSETMPPADGWLAGYSISYYYFGYLLAAMMSLLSGVNSATGYNMTSALWFALTGLTAFGVVYNAVCAHANRDPSRKEGVYPGTSAVMTGLLATIMVVLMGNFQVALVEYPYSARMASEAYLRFTGTQNREVYPEREAARASNIPDDQAVTLSPGRADPTQWEFWWWFRASRVLNDYQLNGQVQPNWYAQPIDEFPSFSFLLADNHPHVLALPFVLLAMGLALNIILIGRPPDKGETLLYGLSIGGLVFLNTWDGPIYFLALLAAESIRRLLAGKQRLRSSDLVGIVWFGLRVAILTVILYLPFLAGFRSQASGILPNIITPTFLPHFVIMFGPFITIIAGFLIFEAHQASTRLNLSLGLKIVGALLIALIIVMLVLMLAALFIPELSTVVLRFKEEYGGLGNALPLVVLRRVATLPTTLILLAGLVLIIARLVPRRLPRTVDPGDGDILAPSYSPASAFALMAVGLGLGLVLVPEFFYLRDNFGTRINTIFKFYLQSWMMFSVSGAVGLYVLLYSGARSATRRFLRAVYAGFAVISIGLGLLYPLFGIHNRMFIETGRASAAEPAALTLDGGPTLVADADYSAIRCLESRLLGRDLRVVEAVGPAYNSGYGRVAALAGVPVLLGWENHERQWRGSTYDESVGSRAKDIETLYRDLRWETARDILNQYDVDYVFYGLSERASYGSAGEEKFREHLEAICPAVSDTGQVVSVFYRVADTGVQ